MSRVLSDSESDVAQAAEVLRVGGLVAFPTETVYGLGAAARDPAAVARIYAVKGRPATHPVIVHLASAAWLEAWVAEVPPAAGRLAEAFWPGPMTLVLQRADGVPDAVTGGQSTVGVRVPDHPLALRLLRSFGDGVAAPSANRFGRVSPTTAAHVAEEFITDDVLVLDGGPCRVGLESTIVDLSAGVARVLRPGGVPLEAIERVLGEEVGLAPDLTESLEPGEAPAPAGRGAAVGVSSEVPRAPGRMASHYAPVTPTELVAPGALAARSAAVGGVVGVVARRAPPSRHRGPWLQLPDTPEGYGRELYAALRDLDAAGCRRILIETVPATAPWLAIRDRLRRAAADRRGARVRQRLR